MYTTILLRHENGKFKYGMFIEYEYPYSEIAYMHSELMKLFDINLN